GRCNSARGGLSYYQLQRGRCAHGARCRAAADRAARTVAPARTDGTRTSSLPRRASPARTWAGRSGRRAAHAPASTRGTGPFASPLPGHPPPTHTLRVRRDGRPWRGARSFVVAGRDSLLENSNVGDVRASWTWRMEC